MNKLKKSIIILILFILLIFILFISIIFSILNINNQCFFLGITINNVDISGMTKEEATSILTDLINKKINSTIDLTYENYESNLYLSSLDINYNLFSALDQAYNIGREGNIVQNNYAILSSLLFKKNINMDIQLDNTALELSISDISSNLPNKVIQTNYYIEDNNLIITKGSDGISVNSDQFKSQLTNILNNISSSDNQLIIPTKYSTSDSINIDSIHSEIYKKSQDAYYEEDPFKVYPEIVGIDFDIEKAKEKIKNEPNSTEYSIELIYTYPAITVDNLNIDIFPDLLATFSTRYDAKNINRSKNLQLAANKINETILSPGEEFSYNTIVGERSIAAGYKEAKVYSNGEVVDGIGGGICQISSTLYNAVVFSNLKVTERHNHQFLTSYVTAGRDATVVYGLKDLKFINNRSYPIKIFVSVNNGVAKVDIYGIKEDTEYDISFDVKTISNILYKTKYETDNTLEPGTKKIKQAGANGIIVNTYKILKKNGITISTELLSKDTYNCMNRIILTKTGTPLS